MAEVAGLREGFVTVTVPDGGAGQFVEIPCPPHFAPEVGELVPLLMSGPKPKLFPQVIAVDAITAREIKAGSIEAGHITAGAIDGKTITGATFQTSAVNPKGFFDVAGLRFVNSAGVVLFEVDAATASALITGEYRSAASGARFIINSGGTNPGEIRFYGSGTTYGTIVLTPTTGAFLLSGPPNPFAPRIAQVSLDDLSAVVRLAGDPALPNDTSELRVLSTQAELRKVQGSATAIFQGVTFGTAAGDGQAVVTSSGQVDLRAPTVNVGLTSPLTNTVAINGPVHFNMTSPPGLPAAATDLASVITLANSMRTVLINLGLAQ